MRPASVISLFSQLKISSIVHAQRSEQLQNKNNNDSLNAGSALPVRAIFLQMYALIN
jgi:hypothetical protein